MVKTMIEDKEQRGLNGNGYVTSERIDLSNITITYAEGISMSNLNYCFIQNDSLLFSAQLAYDDSVAWAIGSRKTIITLDRQTIENSGYASITTNNIAIPIHADKGGTGVQIVNGFIANNFAVYAYLKYTTSNTNPTRIFVSFNIPLRRI